MRAPISALAAGLGAALLFAAQPLLTRMLLPHLGGGPQVWTTAAMVFQACLLAGYLYAHGLARALPPAAGAAAHLGLWLVVLAWGLPPALPDLGAAPDLAAPAAWTVRALLGAAGPYLVLLAATTPLVQTWTARRGEDPYPLYAASNLGSLGALLAAPLLLDPWLGLNRQAAAHQAGAALLILALGASWLSSRERPSAAPAASGTPSAPPTEGAEASDLEVDVDEDEVEDIRPPPPARSAPRSLRQVGTWLALAAVPSLYSLALTEHMAREVPSHPLLWVIPLALYLASYVMAFRAQPDQQLGDEDWAWRVLPLALGVQALVLFVPLRLAGFSAHLLAFYLACLVLHRRLVALRPGPGRVTEFDLWIATGGFLGGAAASLVAPALLPAPLELPLAMVATAWLVPRDEPCPSGDRARQRDLALPFVLLAGGLAVDAALPRTGDSRDVISRVGVLLVMAAVAVWCRRRRTRLALSLAAVLAVGFVSLRLPGVVRMVRSPLGSHRVLTAAGGHRVELYHGSTLHGAQDHRDPRKAPTSYFHPSSPIASLLRRASDRRAPTAVVGLGVGALAWYRGGGQLMRFFELDPEVVALAQDPTLFTFLTNAGGGVRVEVADGRRGLAAAEPESYQVIILDAFTSDAVPVHLVTREALEVYRRALTHGGALVFNASNRHMDLEGLLARLALDLGLAARSLRAQDEGPPPPDADDGRVRARWVALAGRPILLEEWAPLGEGWTDLDADPSRPVWTDDHADPLAYLRW